MNNFEIRAKDGLARVGRFGTKHGTVKTPLLMPVVHPGKSILRPKELSDTFGFEMVITNSYIIKSQEKFSKKALEEGVHSLLDFNQPIMTDSGTFQMYFHELPEQEIDPLAIIDFQKKIGSDIGTILDVFSKPDAGKFQVEKDVETSLERARLSVDLKGDMMLAGTIQGGAYQDLRTKSAKAMAAMNFDVYPIGGVVPFMEMYRYADIVKIVLEVKKYLPRDRPVHLFGCGHPMFFAQAAYLGCDFFDSASYAKFAESGRMLFTSGTAHLEELSELPCECPVCTSTTVNELKSMAVEERNLALMKHNLYVSAAEMKRVRQAIVEGKLFELVALRARSHPSLLEALHVMTGDMSLIIQSDPVGKSNSVFYTGPETMIRPEIIRFNANVQERYPYRKTDIIVIVPDIGARPFSDTAQTIIDQVRKRSASSVILLFLTPMGVVPWELEHVHPAQQCIFPTTIDRFDLRSAEDKLHDFLSLISFNRLVWFERDTPTNYIVDTLHEINGILRASSASEVEKAISESSDEIEGVLRKIKAVINYQWGTKSGDLTDKVDLQVELSRNTGKIRFVKSENELLFTLVPTTGLLTPTFRGGQILLETGIDSKYVVTVANDVAEFVASGKSALAKFVKNVDRNLLAGEEVLVVDEAGNLLATGKTLLSGQEMVQFSRGAAIMIRHSLNS